MTKRNLLLIATGGLITGSGISAMLGIEPTVSLILAGVTFTVANWNET